MVTGRRLAIQNLLQQIPPDPWEKWMIKEHTDCFFPDSRPGEVTKQLARQDDTLIEWECNMKRSGFVPGVERRCRTGRERIVGMRFLAYILKVQNGTQKENRDTTSKITKWDRTCSGGENRREAWSMMNLSLGECKGKNKIVQGEGNYIEEGGNSIIKYFIDHHVNVVI